MIFLTYIPQSFRLLGMLVRMRGRDFFDELSNRGGLEHPAAKRKNAISHSKTVALAFGRKNTSREAAVFFNSLSGIIILQSSAKTGTILHGSRKYRGIQTVLSELYNTVEVMNNAE